MNSGENEVQKSQSISDKVLIVCIIILSLVIDKSNFLFFHTIIELICVVIGLMVVVTSLNSLDKSKINITNYLGISYGFVAMIDLLHLISYKGMGILNIESTDIPTQLWISARYIESISILIFTIYFNYNKNIKSKKIIIIYSFLSIILISSIFYSSIFPSCHIEGIGLTLFKKVSEYLIISILLISLIILRKKKSKLDNVLYKYIVYSLWTTIISEVFFVLYIGVYDLSNVIGYLLKLLSYFFIYKLVIEINIRRPNEKLNNLNKFLEKEIEIKNRLYSELIHERELLQAISESSKDGIIVTDNDLNILHMNNSLSKTLNVPRNIMETKNVGKIRESVKNKLKESNDFIDTIENISMKSTYNTDYLYFKNNKVIERNYYPLNMNNIDSGRIWTFRDITDKIKSQQELEIKNKVIETSLNAFIFTDTKGIVTYVNEEFLEIWGYGNKDEVTGKNSKALFSNDINMKDLKLRLLKCGEYFSETTGIRKDGSILKLEAYIKVIYDNNKNAVYFAGSFIDISQKKISESKLKKSRSLYKKLVDILPDALFVTKNNKLVIANGAALKLINNNVNISRLHKMNLFDLITIHPDYKDIVLKRREELLNKDSKARFMEQKIILNNDVLDVEVGGSSFVFEDDNYIISVFRDISERKKALELQKMIEVNEKLLMKEKEYNDLKTQLFSTISHELKTPLNVILGVTQLFDSINNELYTSEKEYPVAKYVQIMKQNCYRLLRLINNILDVNKIDSGYLKLDLKNYNIVNIVEEISLSVVEFVKSKDIDLIFDTDIEEKIMAFDADKLERVLLNLLSNAVKYTGEGGKIYINVYDKLNKIIISVKDTGTGIPDDMKKKIFERFIQVDGSLRRKVEGTGIGLSLVKSIIELHGGKIYVESVFGKGSEFIIELPVNIINEEITLNEEIALANDINVERINIEFSDIYS